MKIVMITGSPHKNGTSALLAEKFIKGAKKAGHEVFRFDAAYKKVSPCRACGYCKKHDSVCVFQDDMKELIQPLFDADAVVFVTPLYYYGMSAQIKAVIDRFYAFDRKLHDRKKKTMLLATCMDTEDWTMSALVSTYQSIIRYIGWEDAGMVLADGVEVRADIEKTDFPEQAEKLGESI